MAEQEVSYLTFEKLAPATKLKVFEKAILNRVDEQELVNGVKALLLEECKKLIYVIVDGNITEVIVNVSLHSSFFFEFF